MLSRKKQKKASEKTLHEDIYLNDLHVEIKQEDELIIEDADHVQWRLIGMDDDDDAIEEICDLKGVQSQNTYYQYQSVSEYAEIIEISDEENFDYEEVATSGGDTSEIFITNEPLQESIVETLRNQNQASPSEDNTLEIESVCAANDTTDPSNENSVSLNACSEDLVKKTYDCELKTTTLLPFNNDKLVGNVDCFNVGAFIEWMSRKLIKMCCHICGAEFQHNVYTWLSHMKLNHPKILREIATKYKPVSESVIECKVCKMQVTPKINHTFHYLTRHMEPKAQIFSCSFCEYKNFLVATLQRHHVENHPTAIGKREKCPKCGESFKGSTALDYHFMSAHIREFNGKYVYKCHLCDVQFESSKNKLFAHLIDKHKLGNWKTLNYRKIENGAFLSCTKCHKTFIKTNVNNLLGHYLTHEDKIFWSCKYCKSTNRFRDWPLPHLCRAMRDHLKGKIKVATETTIDKINMQQTTHCERQERPVSWDEFEACIEHICPFCNKGFLQFEEWRYHVRDVHFIHTLQGLNMSVLPQETDNLLCLECNAHVPKSALELHKHRFRHLPFEPYKCRHCGKCLSTYSKAVTHVQNNCQDGGHKFCCGQTTADQTVTNRNDNATPSQESAQEYVIIICPLCNNKRFTDFTQLSKHFSNAHDNFDKYFSKPSKDRSRSCKICSSDVKRNKLNELIAHFLQHLNERPFKCQKCLRSYPVYKIALKHVRLIHLSNTSVEQCFRCIKEEPECYLPATSTSKQGTERKSQLTVTPISALQSDVTPTSDCMLSPNPKCPSSPVFLTPPPSQPAQKSSTPIKEDGSSEMLNVADFKAQVFKMYEQYIRFACPECNEPFISYIKWEDHIHSVHSFYKKKELRCSVSAKGRVKCLDCHSYVEIRLSKQQNHKLIHMPYRSFICTFCLNHFTAIAALYKHFRKIHFSRGKFQCDICLKMLRTDSDRFQHVKQDHPHGNWPIDMCIKCFKIVEDMEAHMQFNHLDHSRKYRCETCGLCFEFPKELEVHMEKMHSKQKAANEISPQMATTINRSGAKRKLRSLSSDDNAKKFRPSLVSQTPTRHYK